MWPPRAVKSAQDSIDAHADQHRVAAKQSGRAGLGSRLIARVERRLFHRRSIAGHERAGCEAWLDGDPGILGR